MSPVKHTKPDGGDKDWQLRAYEEAMGRQATERQVLAERRRRGKCVCRKRTEKLRGLFYTIHKPDCPKRRPWMDGIEREIAERDRAVAAHTESDVEAS